MCALNHRIVKPWEKPREKRTPTKRLSRDRTRWSGIHGWLYGLVRTSALGRIVDLSLNPEASKCRGEGGKGDSRARPRTRLENMLLDL